MEAISNSLHELPHENVAKIGKADLIKSFGICVSRRINTRMAHTRAIGCGYECCGLAKSIVGKPHGGSCGSSHSHQGLLISRIF
jgi:hypothetical protein